MKSRGRAAMRRGLSAQPLSGALLSVPKSAPLVVLVLFATILRLLLVPLYAHLPNGAMDERYWKDWMRAIHERGVLNIFRTTDTDYVGYHWILAALTLLQDHVVHGSYLESSASLHALVKLPPIAFDAELIVVTYLATARLVATSGRAAMGSGHTTHLPLIAAGIVAVHPAVVYDSAVWAQTDAAIAAAMVAALTLAASRRPATGWAVLAMGFLLKPHPIVIVPVLAVMTAGLGARACARSLAAVAAVFALVLGPWLLHGDALRILDVYHRLFSADYERLSASAWNLWWFWDLFAPARPGDPVLPFVPMLSFRLAGLVLSAGAALVAVAAVMSRRDLRTALLAGAYLALAFYVLPVSSHDRYMYPFLVLMLPVVLIERQWLIVYATASVTFFLNLLASAPPLASQSGVWIDSPWSAALAAVHVFIFAHITVALVREVAAGVPSMVRSGASPGRLQVSAGSVDA